MIIETLIFGKIEVPNTKNEIINRLENCRKQYINHPSRYKQAEIDALEEELDKFRRKENVRV